MYRIIVFDFDGVIYPEGEIIKEHAWEELAVSGDTTFATALSKARTVYKNGKGSRYDIIETALRACTFSDAEVPKKTNELATRYDAMVQKKIVQSGVPQSIRALLTELQKNYSLYINSATPEDALLTSCHNLHITHFFKAILGKPHSKEDNLRAIMRTENCDTHDILFVGDSDGDLHAATACNVAFVGIKNKINNWKCNNEFHTFNFLTDLHTFLLSKN